jgi:ribosomal protein S18 acetylase RimI-like enzyme
MQINHPAAVLARRENDMKEFTVQVDGDNTVIIKNDNTTIGYATIDADAGYLTYIFVNPAFRRRGYGFILLDTAQKATGRKLQPAAPISPLGEKFFDKVS